MSQASVGWQTIEAGRNTAADRRRRGVLIAVGLLCAVTAAEVLFLRFVAGPDNANMPIAAEGITPSL
jgi:hypothetical protein